MTRRPLLACGVISSVLYLTAIDVLAPIAYPGYHGYTSQMVSELLAWGAPTRALLFLPMLLYNVLVFAFAAGVWASAGKQRARVLTAAALVGYGVCSTVGLLLAPMELRVVGISEQTRLHIWDTVLQGVFIALVLVCGAFVHGARFRLYSLATLAVCVVFGALASLEAAQASMRWIGLTERVNIYTWMLWLAVLALTLLPPRGQVVASSGDRRRLPRRTATEAFITRHQVASYFALTFALSWGGVFIVAGPGGLSVHSEPSASQLPFAYLAMLAGPSLAGSLLIGLVHGRPGFREWLSRLRRWRVGVRWYAVAILIAPLVMTAVLLVLSLLSPAYRPGILAASDKTSLLLASLAAGLVVGALEELGWTGCAVPGLRLRHGVMATGLIVGVLWGAWHFLVFFWGSGASSGALSPAIYLPVQLFSFLPAFRVLMVWVYDRCGSLLVAMLMHASLTASTFILAPLATGVPTVTYDLTVAAALWLVVAAVAMTNGWYPARRPLPTEAA